MKPCFRRGLAAVQRFTPRALPIAGLCLALGLAAANPALAGGDEWPFPSAGLKGEALERARIENAPLWLNARPLFTAAEDPAGKKGIVSLEPSLAGKAVLLHFWDYTNAHCLEMVPLLEAWQARYAKAGLVIVGVHAPQFPFTARSANVVEAVKRLGISYAVYLDSDFLLWRVFANQHWPRTILIAPGGSVIHDAIGAAQTVALEKSVRSVLRDKRGRRFSDAPLPPLPRERDGAVCHAGTPDIFCGFERGRLGAPGYRKDGAPADYHIPSHAEVRQDDTIYLEGPWQARRQALVAAGGGPWEMRLRFRAVGVGLVMAPPPSERGARVRVTLDGKPVPPLFRGADLRVGPGGETTVTIGTPRLLRLVKQVPFAHHEIALFPESPGTAFYVFYFEACE
ncbi:MAG: hypothetical protein ACE5FC_02090 [Myxococcota bacterium]